MGAQPFPEIETWTISPAAIDATLAAVQPAGDDGREAGVFWMGRREATASVEAVLVLHGPGVVEERGFWQVSPEVFGVIGTWARPRGLNLLAICHIHGEGVPARLSWVDRNHLVRAPGVLAVVIGEGGRDEDPQRWGWYVFDDGEYRELGNQDRGRLRFDCTNAVAVWTADQTGCRPAA